MPKTLKTPYLCKEGVLDTLKLVLVSLRTLLWPSFDHNMWFSCIGHHLNCKAFDLIYFGIVLASLKGCLSPTLVDLIMCSGRNQGGIIGLVACTHN